MPARAADRGRSGRTLVVVGVGNVGNGILDLRSGVLGRVAA